MAEILIRGITLPKNQDQKVHVGINRLGKMKATLKSLLDNFKMKKSKEACSETKTKCL